MKETRLINNRRLMMFIIAVRASRCHGWGFTRSVVSARRHGENISNRRRNLNQTASWPAGMIHSHRPFLSVRCAGRRPGSSFSCASAHRSR